MANPSDARPMLVNELLVLALLRLCSVFSGNPVVGDRLKVTKLTFLATHRLYQAGYSAFALSFYKYTYGPFTKELYEVWDDLSAAGMVDVGPGPSSSIALTPNGLEFGSQFLQELFGAPQNEKVATAFAEIAGKYARESTGGLLRDVYQLRLQPVGYSVELSVADVPMGVYLTRELPSDQARGKVNISEEWLIRYDIARQSGWARDEQLAELVGLHTPQVVREIQEALEADLRGEVDVFSMERIEERLGIRRSA